MWNNRKHRIKTMTNFRTFSKHLAVHFHKTLQDKVTDMCNTSFLPSFSLAIDWEGSQRPLMPVKNFWVTSKHLAVAFHKTLQNEGRGLRNT